MPMKLYQRKESPPSRSVLMMIELLGLEVELVEVNTLAGEQHKPEYLKKNPQHSIPLLEDGDLLIADSHVILTYLVSKYGGNKSNLYPTDLKARAMIDQRLYFNATFLFPRVIFIIRACLTNEKALTEKNVNSLTEAYSILETHLQKSAYVAGDSFSVADVSCVATLSSAHFIVAVDAKYVKIHEWWNRLKAEEWYKKANEPGLVSLGSFLVPALKKNSENYA